MNNGIQQQGPLVMSIDWDYFMPTPPHGFCLPWDSVEFSNWQASAFKRRRGQRVSNNTPYRIFRVDAGACEVFLRNTLGAWSQFDLRVAESHESIVDFTNELDDFDVISFDAHHDLGYSDYDPGVNCGNWARHLRQSRRLRSYTLVYPRWRYRYPEHSFAWLPEGADRVFYGDWLGARLSPTKVFVCRSSTWMPPWCDKEWAQLISRLKARPVRSAALEANILAPREFDVIKAAEQALAACEIRSLNDQNAKHPIPSLCDLSQMAGDLLRMMNDPARSGEAQLLASKLRDYLADYGFWEDVNFGGKEGLPDDF
jgi:hypothetical protein